MQLWLKILLLELSGAILGFILCLLAKKIISLKMLGNGVLLFLKGFLSRVDRLLTGNDANYSHVRFLNVMWGIGNFVLIAYSIIKDVTIPGEVLIFMGGAMGISNTQALINKAQEVKQVVQLKKDGGE